MRKPIEPVTTESTLPKLQDLLKHPEDLDKIPFLKAEFTRKKAAIDAQLKTGIKEQNDRTQHGMDELKDAQRKLQEIKEEMMKIDRLCTEAKNMVSDVPNLGRIATISRNFQMIEKAKAQLETFNPQVDNLENLLRIDAEDLDNQPNLLEIHRGLTELRDFRDEAMDQIKVTKDRSMENTLIDHLSRLDDVIEDFDRNFGYACMNMVDFVQADNRSILVRLALVIEKEEQSDKKAQAMQDARQQYAELASRFKSINISSERQLRGYKEKFLKTIEFVAQQRFDETEPAFLDDPDKLNNQMKWFFNNLFAVKQGMTGTMPKKWKIYDTYTHIYHARMHDFLIKFVDNPELSPPHMLAISDWIPQYYKSMEKLGWQAADLSPHVIDERDPELIREYRQLIVKAVDSWMDRMHVNDRRAFVNLQQDYIESNGHGYFRTKTLSDLWRMLHEQTLHAGSSNRADVVEGVIDAMFSALKQRQQLWQAAINDETARYSSSTPSTIDPEGVSALQDWLIALANDQITCVDDSSSDEHSSYLARLQTDFEPLVTPAYISARAIPEIDTLRLGFIDLATSSIASFISLIFSIDFRSTLQDFFTPKWYTETGMRRICSTFEDYLADYKATLHPTLLDVFVEELADQLLISYLSCIRNKHVKFRRSGDAFVDKFRDDVITAFEFFEALTLPSSPEANDAPPAPPLVPGFDFPALKAKYKAINFTVRLLEADKTAIVGVFEEFKTVYPDVQVGWVEAVLRSRDDFERAMSKGVKAKAGKMSGTKSSIAGGEWQGMETVMGKVK